MVKNYQSIHVKLAPTGKSIAAVDLEKIKKKISVTNNPSLNFNIQNINRSKEFSANSITNSNSNNSHLAVNNSIGKHNQSNQISNNILTNNNYLSKGNIVPLNNSKNKSEMNQNIGNNNSKINLKASLNFSNNECFNPGSSYINPNPNRFTNSNKNINFIAPAHLKNVNSRNDSNAEKINKINEFKFSSNYFANPKSPINEDASKKSKSIRIKLKDKDAHEDFLNDSYQKQTKKNANEGQSPKEKSKQKDTLMKNFSKDHFKDLKGQHNNVNEIITKRISGQEPSVTQYLPIKGNNAHYNDFSRSKNLQNSLNPNQRLRNNINITNNSSYDDNKYSFHRNLKNSRLKNVEEKEKTSSPLNKKDSLEKNKNLKSYNIPIDVLNKNQENNSLRNSQIQIKNIIQNKNFNSNANLKSSNSTIAFNLNYPVNNYNQQENLKKSILDKKASESIIEKEKRILGNFNKIEKLRNLELKDLDSLEMKTNESEANYTGYCIKKNSNEDDEVNDKGVKSKRNSKENSSNLAEKDKISNEVSVNNELYRDNSIKVPVNNFNDNSKNHNTSSKINLQKANDEEIELNDSLEKSSSKGSNKENENPNSNLKIKSNNKSLSNRKSNSNNENNNCNHKENVLNNNIQATNLNSDANHEQEIKINPPQIQINNSIYINNPQIPYEYLKDIHSALSQEEIQISSFFGYMKNHSDINEQMRAILVDWIIEVHSKFNLKEETLFLCVFIIDKFLKSEIIPRSKLQLLGVASIMIACKQEEIYSPSIKDFVFITDNAYSKEEIFEMEYHILKVLEFNTVMPSSLRFYELIALDFNFDSKQFNFGLYLLELYLIDYRMTKHLPSVIACTAAYIVMKFFKLPNYTKIYSNWNRNTNSSSLIKDCAREICFLVDNINGSSLKATKKKFSQDKYDSVSLINFF